MAVALQTLIDRSVRNMGSGIHPQVKEYAVELVKRAYSKGIYVQITSGYRSNAEQTRLYNQGRTTPGNIVTNAKAGQSIHNYGLAIDYALLSPSGVMHWDIKRDMNANQVQDWFEVAAIGKSMGFQWGGDWKSFVDYPHLDMQRGMSLANLAKGKRPTIPPLKNVTPVSSNPLAKGYLEKGDRGTAVGTVQKELNQAGAKPPLTIDNYFWVAMENRVKTFQKTYGLTVDGVYGPASIKKMKEVLADLNKPKPVPKPKPVTPVTKPTIKEDDVLDLHAGERKDLAAMFKEARERGVFESSEHEKAILDGTMTQSRLIYLTALIAGAGLAGGERIK